ncbi:MAG: M14 family zinc carboxypeptidase, partial [Candidatus Sericytochromatia bacterium]
YSEMFFWPQGYSEKPIPEVPTFKTIYQNTFAHNHYEGGTSLELLYPTSGTSDDYGYDECGSYSMGLEVGQSFRPSYAEVEAMWKATRPNWLYMINAAGTVPPLNYRCR